MAVSRRDFCTGLAGGVFAKKVGDEVFVFEPDASRYTAKATGGGAFRKMADRFADVLNPKDFSAKGDGSADDTSAFASLESVAEQGKEIDLFGKTYKVDSLPVKCKYRNGWFSVNGFLYPTDDIYNKAVTKVSPNNGNYNAWPQDTAHNWNGVLYTFFNQDIYHASPASHPILAFSIDGGNSFPFNQHIAVEAATTDSSTPNGAVVFSAGITDRGTQLAVLNRGHTESTSDEGADTANKLTLMLIGRKAFEFIEYRDNYSYPYEATISSTANSDSYTFTLENGHGFVVGDTLLAFGSKSIGGNTLLNALFTVTSVESLTSCTMQTSVTALSTETVDCSGLQLRLNEYGKFHEMKFDGTKHLGTKLKEVTGASYDPTLAHSLCIINDDAYFCIHGRGYNGSYLVKISNVSLATRSLSVVFLKNEGCEGTLANLGNGYLVGALRPQSSSYPLRFFTYKISTGSVSFQDTRFGVGHFLYSPAPVRIVGDNDKEVVFCMSESRGGAQETIPIIIAHAKLSDVVNNLDTFESLLKYEVIATTYNGHTSSGSATAAGVPSLTSIGSNLFLFYSSDHPMAIADRDGFPHVYCCRLDFSRFVAKSKDTIVPVLSNNSDVVGIRGNLYSSPEWQTIRLHTKLYSGRGETGIQLRRGLRAEWDESSAEVYLFFTTEDSGRDSPKRDFPIGHTHYSVIVSPNALFSSLDGTETGVGMYVVDTVTSASFRLRGRMATVNSTTSKIGFRDGIATCDVEVMLKKPVDWLDY